MKEKSLAKWLGLSFVASLALVPVALGCACGDKTLSAPRPERVEPAIGYNLFAMPIAIKGKHFYRRVTHQMSKEAEFAVDSHFVAELVRGGASGSGQALEDVAYVDDETLTATVPPGIDAGLYDLRLTGPSGLTGSLLSAYTATDQGPPEIVEITPAAVVNDADTPIAIRGANFFEGLELRLGDAPLETREVRASRIESSVPAGFSVGTHAVTVRNPDGQLTTDENGIQVFEPALLTAILKTSPEMVKIGERLVLELTVSNEGATAVESLSPGEPLVLGDGSVQIVTGPEPTAVDVPASGAQLFSWTYQAQGSGDLVFEVAASGLNEHSSRPVGTGSVRSKAARIIQCAGSSECHNPTPICTLVGRCEACTSDEQCRAAKPDTQRCDTSTGACLPCVAHADCGAPWAYCDPDTKACVECLQAGHCDDLNPCTDDSCLGHRCLNENNTIPCDDGLFCTLVDLCSSGSCTGSGDPCAGGSECQNACDEIGDTCNLPSGTACTDDGQFCSGPEVCDGLGNCGSSGDPCPGRVCDEWGDACADHLLVDDPVGDASSFSFVFSYRNRIWVGPRTDGTGAVSMAPNGSSPSLASFSFFKDVTDNSHDNKSTDPYPSIGFSGCAKDTAECGPDNEDGRGLFGSGVLGTDEWLIVGGGRSGGNLEYVYMTRDSDDLLDFSYLELKDVLGGATKGISAARVFGNRLYLGFPDTGGSRPYLVVVFQPPTPPGLDAVGNGGGACDPMIHDVCDLKGDDLPDVGKSADTSIIDSIFDYNDRLYVANNGGVVRSTTNQPLDVDDRPQDWTRSTPSAAEYTARISITTDKTADIEPRDKAVPGMASFGGRLFFARNTTVGPQLWACTPDIQTGPAPATANDCDPGDWQLVAPNTVGDALLAQLNNPNNTHISLLVASESYLYVGFDNPTDGLVLFRTADPAAANRADFEGRAGCPADQHPAGCEGIGGNGFGDTTVTRIFSYTVSSLSGTDWLYVIVGDGTNPVKLYIFSG